MPILTYIARFTDGLLLVAATEHSGEKYEDLDRFKKQAKLILKRLTHHSELELSLTSEVRVHVARQHVLPCPNSQLGGLSHRVFDCRTL